MYYIYDDIFVNIFYTQNSRPKSTFFIKNYAKVAQ